MISKQPLGSAEDVGHDCDGSLNDPLNPCLLAQVPYGQVGLIFLVIERSQLGVPLRPNRPNLQARGRVVHCDGVEVGHAPVLRKLLLWTYGAWPSASCLSSAQ